MELSMQRELLNDRLMLEKRMKRDILQKSRRHRGRPKMHGVTKGVGEHLWS